MAERRPSIYLLGSGFFGLNSSYRLSVFSQIHQIVFHGNGGYSWTEVYNMPIWLRKFTYENIKEYHEKINKQSQNNTATKKPDIKGPDIKPSYSSKASRK